MSNILKIVEMFITKKKYEYISLKDFIRPTVSFSIIKLCELK
jgi:hypothetical protein